MPSDFDDIWGSVASPVRGGSFDDVWGMEEKDLVDLVDHDADPVPPEMQRMAIAPHGLTPEQQEAAARIPGAEMLEPSGPQVVTGDDQGLFREAVGAGARGMIRVGRGLAGAFKAGGGTKEEIADQLIPALEKLETQFPRQSMEGKSLPAKGVNYFVNLVGEQVPYMSAGLTAMGLVGPAGFVGTTFAVEGGNAYEDARQRGVDKGTAIAEGIGVGSVTAALDIIPAGEYFSGWISRNPAVRSAFRKIGAGALGDRATKAVVTGQAEGLTEAGQEVASALIQWAAENDPEALKDLDRRALDAYLAGTTLGTAIGGAIPSGARQEAPEGQQQAPVETPQTGDSADAQEVRQVREQGQIEGRSPEPARGMQRGDEGRQVEEAQQWAAEADEEVGRGKPLGITAVNEEQVKKAADEIAAGTRARLKRIGDHSKGAVAFGRRMFQRFENWVAHLGETGQKISQSTKRVSHQTQEQYSNSQIDFDNAIRGYDADELELAMKVMNGVEMTESARINNLANRIRDILDRPMNEFAAMGGKRNVDGQYVPIRGSGKAYPQVLNSRGREIVDEAHRDGLRSQRVQKTAIQMVRSGKARTVDEALSALLKARDRHLRNVNPYLESTRVELPEELIEWNPRKTIYGLLRRGWMTVESAREWGEFDEQGQLLTTRSGALLDRGLTRLNADLERLANETDGKSATEVRRYLETELGSVPHEEPRAAGLFGTINNYQTLVRLGGSILSAVRNSFQPFTTLSDLPLRAHLAAYKDLPPFMRFITEKHKQIAEDLRRTGAIQAETSVTHIEDPFGGVGKITKVALAPFSLAEQGNQLHTALAQARAIEMDLARLEQLTGQRTKIQKIIDSVRSLTADEVAAIQRRFERVGLSDERIAEALSGERPLTPDEIKFAMAESVSGSQFPLTLATKRVWWQNPGMRLLGKFKPFGLDMVGYIYERVIIEARKGNFAPLVKFLIFTTIAGEIYNILRDFVLGKEESLTTTLMSRPDKRTARDIAGRIFNNFVDGGGVGMLADLFYGFQQGANPAESSIEWVAGPAGSTAVNMGQVVRDTWDRPADLPASVKDAFAKEIVVSRQARNIIDKTNRWLGETENRRPLYRKWKSRSIDYQRKRSRERGTSTFVGTAVGPRAKRLDLAARDISVGDIEGAADRLLSLMRDAKSREQQRSIIDSIKSSMSARSPLGRVSKRERRRFLAPFPADEREEARLLQKQWMKDYSEAIRIARRTLREEQRLRGRR